MTGRWQTLARTCTGPPSYTRASTVHHRVETVIWPRYGKPRSKSEAALQTEWQQREAGKKPGTRPIAQYGKERRTRAYESRSCASASGRRGRVRRITRKFYARAKSRPILRETCCSDSLVTPGWSTNWGQSIGRKSSRRGHLRYVVPKYVRPSRDVFRCTGYAGSRPRHLRQQQAWKPGDGGSCNVIVEQQELHPRYPRADEYPTLSGAGGDAVMIPADPASGVPAEGSFWQVIKL